MTWRLDAINDIQRDENCRLEAYQDGLGVWTIGYGHTRGVKSGDTCTLMQAVIWLADDIGIAEGDLDRHAPWWNSAPNPVKRGLLNMSFNLGWTRLSQFKKMLEAGEARRYSVMADEAEASRWAHQVGDRDLRIAALFRSAAQIELVGV